MRVLSYYRDLWRDLLGIGDNAVARACAPSRWGNAEQVATALLVGGVGAVAAMLYNSASGYRTLDPVAARAAGRAPDDSSLVVALSALAAGTVFYGIYLSILGRNWRRNERLHDLRLTPMRWRDVALGAAFWPTAIYVGCAGFIITVYALLPNGSTLLGSPHGPRFLAPVLVISVCVTLKFWLFLLGGRMVSGFVALLVVFLAFVIGEGAGHRILPFGGFAGAVSMMDVVAVLAVPMACRQAGLLVFRSVDFRYYGERSVIVTLGMWVYSGAVRRAVIRVLPRLFRFDPVLVTIAGMGTLAGFLLFNQRGMVAGVPASSSSAGYMPLALLWPSFIGVVALAWHLRREGLGRPRLMHGGIIGSILVTCWPVPVVCLGTIGMSAVTFGRIPGGLSQVITAVVVIVLLAVVWMVVSALVCAWVLAAEDSVWKRLGTLAVGYLFLWLAGLCFSMLHGAIPSVWLLGELEALFWFELPASILVVGLLLALPILQDLHDRRLLGHGWGEVVG